MAASNFASILDRPANEIERPRSLPAGTYLCTVKGQPRFDKSSQKQTPFVEFTLVPTQAGDDVDEDDLRAALTDKNSGELKPLSSVTLRHTLYETEASAYRIVDFLEHCGLDVNSGQSPRALIAETTNCQVYATIRHEATQDGKGTIARVRDTAAVE